jgi:hypothetical protein
MIARSAPEIWEAALGQLQLEVNKANFRTWLSKTIGLNCQDKHFIVGVPNTFVAEYLEKNQRSLIEKALTGILPKSLAQRGLIYLCSTPGTPSILSLLALPITLPTPPPQRSWRIRAWLSTHCFFTAEQE